MSKTVYNQLYDQQVRDLYWLLFSPSPVGNIPPPWKAPLFPEEIIESWKQTSGSYFKRLDSHPEMLHQFLNRKKYKRLGFYAEALLSYFFQTFEPIELLLQNFQVREEKQTLGEIDFIFNYDNVTYHIELAVKYYLLLKSHSPDVPKNWVGPSLNDHFERKLNKIQARQLPLGQHRKVLHNLSAQQVHSYFFFRGCFFTHDRIHSTVLNTSKTYSYCFKNELDKNVQLKKQLHRPNWMSAVNPAQEDLPSSGTSRSITSDRPSLWINGNNEPLFILPNSWDQ